MHFLFYFFFFADNFNGKSATGTLIQQSSYETEHFEIEWKFLCFFFFGFN